jgi:GntR family transcriptional regulator, transcriptional repressor for pyruvate dehydrogenase complex
MYKTFKATKISGEVANHCTELIVQQQLQAGDKLPSERELCEQFGISRTVLREAVKMLEEKGLLDSKQGSGTYVRSVSPQAISDSVTLYVRSDQSRYIELMELRSILDVELAGRLAEKASDAEVAALTHHIENMWQLLDSPEAFSAEDVAFHTTFYTAMHNSVLMSIVQPIMDLLEDVMRMSFTDPGSMESSLKRHVALVDCIRNRDSEGARRTMRAIISRGEQRVEDHLLAAQATNKPGSDT